MTKVDRYVGGKTEKILNEKTSAKTVCLILFTVLE